MTYEELIPQVNARVFRKKDDHTKIIVVPQEIVEYIIEEYLKINGLERPQ